MSELQTTEQFLTKIKGIEGPLGHAIIFNFYESSSDVEVQTAIEMCRGLSDLPGVLSLEVYPSLDRRKGRTALELGVFASGQAFLEFRENPRHEEFANYIKNHADWKIVDFPVVSSSMLANSMSKEV